MNGRILNRTIIRGAGEGSPFAVLHPTRSEDFLLFEQIMAHLQVATLLSLDATNFMYLYSMSSTHLTG